MQNTPLKRFRVTDGGNVNGQFRTRKDAQWYLENSQIFTGGVWKPLAQDGFFIERLTDEEGWER